MTISEKHLISESYCKICDSCFRDIGEDASIDEFGSFDLNTLSSISSFKKKVMYCRKFLKHLGTGSSRIVFLLPNGHALKLSYNRKGLAQNEAEAGDYVKDSYDCFAKAFNVANDFMWIESEVATKCRKTDFQTLLGVTFEEMCDMLVLIVRMRGRGTEFRYRLFSKPLDELKTKLDGFLDDEGNFFHQINDYIGNYGIGETVTDLFRLANWGIVTRNNEKWLVVIDSGLNEEVYDQYYAR